MTADTPTRRRGKELEEAIYQAVWEELHDVGYAGMTMDRVAKRAGTSKPVLYRRWSSKVEMMSATALRFLPHSETVPDAGNLRDNAVSVLKVMRQRMFTVSRHTMLGLFTEVARDPATHRQLLETFTGYMRKVMSEVVIDRATASGEITPEQVTDRVRTVPLELARMEFLVTGDLPDSSIEEIVDQVFVPAVRARASGRDGASHGGPDLV